jgi:cytochrome b pre-mRNA-processing protein 3
MNNNFLNIYNNLIKLTRNKKLYENISNNESFSDRLIMFFFHFAFFLKLFKKKTSKKNLQDLYDYIFKQIELSIREIGYGDASINKKMKEYVNVMYAIIDRVELWEELDSSLKSNFFSKFIDVDKKSSFFVSYFDKYALYLTKNSFNYFTKEVISLKF